MGIADMKEYRRLAEYNDTVLAGMYSEQHGSMFTTWRQSKDRSYVSGGDYSLNYACAKESFATRFGLIDENRLFTEEETANLYRCVDFTKGNCATLTYEQEKALDALVEKCSTTTRILKNPRPPLNREDTPQLNM